VDFAVLGPLRCTVGIDDVTPQRRREAALLCALLLEPGASVPAETLAAAVWQDAPPDSWPKALQMHVLRLRETIGRSNIETTPSGYRLITPSDSIDATVFAADLPPLLTSPAGLDTEVDTRATALLDLWRGVPFEELGEWPPAVFARGRLGQLRADALDARAVGRVTRGVASVGELTDLVNDDPLREQRWALLTIALYRAGRQTEALQAFQRARKTLAVEFGLEPGPDLVALERAILDHDARLDARDSGIGAFGGSPPHEFQRRARELFDLGDRTAAIAMLEDGIGAAREREGDPRLICEACIDLAEFARAAGDWRGANTAVDDAARRGR
jgi:DNA-binding SARP family transcriptional activator